MSGIRIGLLLNFNASRLIDGLRRYVVSWRSARTTLSAAAVISVLPPC